MAKEGLTDWPGLGRNPRGAWTRALITICIFLLLVGVRLHDNESIKS